MIARDFESPADANTDNVYEVTLVATDDDGNTASEAFTVTVTDVVETAVFTIDAIADTTVAENTAFTSVTPNLSGATPIGSVTYTLSWHRCRFVYRRCQYRCGQHDRPGL